MSARDLSPNDAQSKEDLWARFADQGLFRDPILQDGYLSITKSITEVKGTNDER
jgi:hypothetical protein